MDLRGNRNQGYSITRNLRNGRIHEVTMTLQPTRINQGWNYQEWFEFIADTLKEYILMQIQYTFGVRRHQIINHYDERSGRLLRSGASGRLLMEGTGGHSRNSRSDNVTVSEINAALIATMFERAHQSNLDLSIYDSQFRFWINPASIDGGGAKSMYQHAGCFNNIPFEYSITYNGEEIGATCAAVALEWLLAYESNTLTAKEFNDKARTLNFKEDLIRRAFIKQSVLGWIDIVTVSQIEDYLRFIPDHRIVVLTPNVNCAIDNDFPGDDYVFDDHRKILYLYLDYKTKHYYAVKSPRECLMVYRGKHRDTSWCFRCSTIVVTGTCNCPEEYLVESRKRKKDSYKECKCGAILYKPKEHLCDFTKCKFCKKYFKYQDKTHRCPIYNDKYAEKYLPFIGEPGADPKKSPVLIVYDFESSLVVEEKQVMVYDSALDQYVAKNIPLKTKAYKLDKDDYFIEDENGPTFFEINKKKHVVNLVVWKNVFTGETWHKSTNILDFLEYLFNVGHQNVICLAHNSSGYDAKLIFEQIVSHLFDRRDIDIKTLLKGSKFMQLMLELGNFDFYFRWKS